MQTRRKVLPKTTPKLCRQQKKGTLISEKKVTELITSSARKQKYVGLLSKQNICVDSGRDMTLNHALQDEKQNPCLADESSQGNKESSGSTEECMQDIIFSPSFHHSKDIMVAVPANELSRNIVELDHKYLKVEGSKDMPNDMLNVELNNPSASSDYRFSTLENLTDVSAIYLAMQSSKLECVDEQSQETMSTDGAADPDECDNFDDFDPYLFIKDLPELSAVVPKFRPMLLPKQTRSCPSTTLVLDLDETLVHSTLEPCQDADFTFAVNFNFKKHTIYVRCRPYLRDFLDRVSGLFETIIFTASQSIYAEQLLNVIDPKKKVFRHRVYRESCVFVNGNYLKDLSVLGRDLARVIIIDNSPQAFGFQLDNGIPIESWFDNCNDRELISLLPFLESLVNAEDVRPLIAKKFSLRDKVAAAACLSIDFRR